MRVLLVSEDLPSHQLGGLARHVVVLGNALIEAGHVVTLMGRSTPKYEDCAQEIGFNGHFLPAISADRGWKEVASGCFNPWKRGYYAASIAKAILVHAQDFDVVHYHGHSPMINLHVPVALNFVQTRHDQGSECLTHMRFKAGGVCSATDPRVCAGCIHPNPGPLRTAISAYAVKRYREQTVAAFSKHPVVFVSEFLRTRVKEVLPTADLSRSEVVHAFIDEFALPHSIVSGPVSDSVSIHVAGRLAETKGILCFLRLLKPRLPETWTVRIFGDGPDRDAVLALCSANVVWHGHRSTQEVMASSSSATVAVVPSLWEEAWGAVTAEAIRFGVPCYALGRGGTPELAQYGAPGQLKLFDSMADLVDGLLLQPIPAHRVGGFSADVRARLPELIRIYQRNAIQPKNG